MLLTHLLHGGVDEGIVAHVHEVAEEAAEDVLGDGADEPFEYDVCKTSGFLTPLVTYTTQLITGLIVYCDTVENYRSLTVTLLMS